MKLLVVEDDRDLCLALSGYLRERGYAADFCRNGADAAYYIGQGGYDVILLDRLLPGRDGMGILRDMRSSGDITPVILITAVGGVDDRVEGLDTGADDYLVKPFALSELEARIRTVLRRNRSSADATSLTYRGVTLDSVNRRLCHGSASCSLTPREYELADYLFRHPDTTLARETLYSRVWGADSEVESGNLDNYVYFLRRRLKTLQAPVSIRTVYKVGFRLEGEK